MAAIVWWALLAGLLIFNKPFASIGMPPLYISECAIVIVMLARFRKDALELLRDSWAFRLIAVFFLYGSVRALFGAREHGFIALRDGVFAGYAIAALLAVQAWRSEKDVDASDLIRHVEAMFLTIATLAGLLSTLIAFGYVHFSWLVAAGKADLFALSAALAAWAWWMRSVAWIPRESAPGPSPNDSRSWKKVAPAVGLALFFSFVFLTRFQIRSVLLGIVPVTLAVVVAVCHTRRRQAVLGALALVMLILIGPSRLMKPLAVFSSVDQEYKLDAGLEAQAVAPALAPPGPSPAPPLPPLPPPAPTPPPVVPAGPVDVYNPAPHNWDESWERLTSVYNSDINGFSSSAGQGGAINVRWRAAFWVRCCRVTLHDSPLWGLGFGTNLTDVMRDTSAWPMYELSQKMVPPNRNPHNAHVTIFSRLGFVGLFLWLGILAVVSIQTLRKLHRCAKGSSRETDAEFWAGLTVFGAWLFFLSAMSVGVVLESPMGGLWFWSLTGVLGFWSKGD